MSSGAIRLDFALSLPPDHRTWTVYWIELPTCENTLFELEPISLTVPTTITRMTASITEYSAMS